MGRFWGGLLLTSLAVLAFNCPRKLTGGEAETVKVPGSALRVNAVNAPMPQYPESSLARRTDGLVAAAIAVNAQGRIVSIEILEAPDAAMRRSVEEALWGWRFKPSAEMSKRRIRITSRLVFYFVLEDDKGTVLNPLDAAALKARGGRH